MAKSTGPNPYSGFGDDAERREALKTFELHKTIRLLGSIVLITIAAAAGVNVPWAALLRLVSLG